MTEIIDYIFKRRSIRSYTDQPLDRQTLISLLQAAMAAPSAVNSQPWEFVVVTDTPVLDHMRKRIQYGQYNAQAIIAVCGSPHIAKNNAGRTYWIQDCSAALENILIAAAGLGLGSVWVGVYPEEEKVQAVRQVLHIPDTVIPLGLVYLGYPAETQPPHTKYDEQKVHWQQYDAGKHSAADDLPIED
jgi:nitroreductase